MITLAHVRPRKPLNWDYAAQPKETVKACNACGGTYWATLAQRDRYGYPVQTHCCYSCGLVFLSPRMTSEAYADFYANTYRALISSYAGQETDVARAQEHYAERLIPLLQEFIPEGAETLLDIGGAPGACAEMVGGHFGLRSVVLDPASAPRIRDGKGSVMGSLESWVPWGKHDLILMCQTVDHLLDLKGGLEKVRSLLTDDGIFWVDIVDWRYRLRQCGSVEGTVKIDHPFNLIESSFEPLLVQCGFGILRKVYQGPHVGYICDKKSETSLAHDYNEIDALLAEIRQRQVDSITGGKRK